MKVSTNEHGDVCVIAISGKIMGGPDTESFHSAVSAAVMDNCKKVVLDLAAVDWMNSSGLGMLVAGRARLANVAGQLRLARPNSVVASLLAMNKLDMIIEVHPTVEAAEASF